MNFEIKTRNGIQLATKGKGLQEDIIVTVDPSIIGSGDVARILVPSNSEVPGDGSLVDVYVNTALSIEEVDAILDTIELAGSSSQYTVYRFAMGSSDVVLEVMKGYPGWIIRDGLNYKTIYDSTGGSGASFNGWNPDFNGIIGFAKFVEENNYGYALSLYDNQNDKLVDLFSCKSLDNPETINLSGEYDGSRVSFTPALQPGTEVSQTAKTDVYINTSLQESEVINILDRLNLDEGQSYVVYGHKGWYDSYPTYRCYVRKDHYDYDIIVQTPAFPEGIYVLQYSRWHPDTVTYIANGIPYSNIGGGDREGVGAYDNGLLTELFSSTPYIAKEFTVDLKPYIEAGKLPVSIEIKL